MAKKEEQLNYKSVVRELKEGDPARLYLLWGQEDYLREQFMDELRGAILPDGADDFSYKKLDGSKLTAPELKNAVDSVPFLSERTLVEVRSAPLNSLKDAAADTFAAVLSDIPEFCTVALVQDSQFEPDGRLKLIKALRKSAKEIKFTPQPQAMLVDWVCRRFRAAGKAVSPGDAQRLIFVSGALMTRLIPEIEKIAAYAAGEEITRADIDAVAHHVPEARIFDMTDAIAARDTDTAARILAELLADKDNAPIMLLATVGMQMRRLYAARLAIDEGRGRAFVEETCAIKFSFIVDKLMSAARAFTLPQLKTALRLCCECDFEMKSTAADDAGLLKELIFRIAAGEADAED